MQIGQQVEWDIKHGSVHLETRQGEVVAVDGWHIVIRVAQPGAHLCPFLISTEGEVRPIAVQPVALAA